MPALIMLTILIILVVWFIVGFSRFEKKDINRQADELEKRIKKYQKEWEEV